MVLVWCARKASLRVPVLTLARSLVTHKDASLSVLEVRGCGEQNTRLMTIPDFLCHLPKPLPIRDLRVFLRSRSSRSGTLGPHRKPTPASGCYIFDMEHIRFLCYTDRCLILDPERPLLQSFLGLLSSDLNGKGDTKSHIRHLYQDPTSPRSDFEHIVLETALASVVNKFNRHLEIIKPPLDVLLQEITQDPATYNLRRLLAFRKSLSEFEASVKEVMKEVEVLLSNDEDLVQLYLTSPERDVTDHTELELIFESYYADFEEIVAEIKTVKDTIEDTNQFISAHLDSVRNKMLRMSLMMEMGALALGSGAVVGGVFGMNLVSGLEEHPQAFLTVLGGMGLMMCGIFTGFSMKYRKLSIDTSSAQSFKALKSFFTYVDDLEHIVNKKRLDEKEFREALNKLTGLQVSEEESDFIFRMLDANKDGLISTENELKFSKSNNDK